MATDATKRPTVKVDIHDVKLAMGLRPAQSCATCAHCAQHPDSYRGGEMGPTMQCVANALFPFIFKDNETRQLVCDHYAAKA